MSNQERIGVPLGDRWLRPNPYREYQPGQQVRFTLKNLQPNGSLTPTEYQITIGDVRGGGFFGKVLIPREENFVIKTSLPDPWHHLWRIINWRLRAFPAQSDEASAQLEHLSGRLIHCVLPVLSEGKFYSPDSLGYTLLPTGYAQVVEKIDGRGPRFDLPEGEFQRFRHAQQELLKIGLNLGLEQVGQIHPNNPFGLANLWLDGRRNTWIWLDTTPAIPHTGWVWPFFYFRFHKDIRHWFYQKAPTFNRIHTGYFLTELARNRHLFTQDMYKQITEGLGLYEALWERRKESQKPEKREVEVALEAFGAVFSETDIHRFVSDPAFRKNKLETFVRIIKDPEYRTYWMNKNFVLKGVEEAKKEGLITTGEWENAWQAIESKQPSEKDAKHKISTLLGIQTFYVVSAEVINAIEASIWASTLLAENKLERASLAFFIGWVLPSILRPTVTMLTESVSRVNLKTATRVSAIPKVGGYLAIPAQIATSTGNETELIWHYTVRNIIASLSKIMRPWGGWGTQFEAELWERLGKKLEKLGKG